MIIPARKIKFRTLLSDPPWTQAMSGQWKKHKAAKELPYKTMTTEEICNLQVGELCACLLYTSPSPRDA